MNILLLANHFNTGGISSYILTLAKGLKKLGHNIYVASGSGELVSALEQERFGYIRVPLKTKAELSINVLVSFFKLFPEIKKKNIQIIHANTRVTQVLACLLSRFSGKPFVSTCHGFFKKRLLRRIFPCWGVCVIAVSSQVKDHLVQDFNVPEDNIELIANGIDIAKFSFQLSTVNCQQKIKFGLGEGPVVGIVARLSEVKGHVYLIRAMQRVVEKFPQAKLLIAGEGKIKTSLERLVQQLGIAKSVFFVPNVKDTRDVLSVMDIFVLSSLQEGLGLSLMEAMCMGKAVIGSSVGGIKTLICHGENGLLVAAADVSGLSAAIIRLLEDKRERELLGVNAREFICANFSQSKMALQTERVYKECVNS
ncbi:MAG: glycosyltransferase family 4 protein [Candidatus Omnitrophica bacterium]|jgi:glycosyltransferase involved in cell wall biosynthesis|nr:glycosyltransferase family 4 protein [Candidatus Omnitrophota bacterium]